MGGEWLHDLNHESLGWVVLRAGLVFRDEETTFPLQVIELRFICFSEISVLAMPTRIVRLLSDNYKKIK
jgi:hypothetical protein